MRAWLVLGVVLALLVSGCSGKAKQVAAPTETATDEYALGEGVTNVLQGRVTGPDESPIANATVLVVSLQTNVTTNEVGEYRFENLEPRDYLVVAIKEGYRNRTQRAIIEDGKIFEMNFKLEERPLAKPYSELLPWSGTIACQARYATNPETSTPVNCSEALEGQQGVNEPSHEFTFNAGGAQVVVEADWEPGSAASSQLTMEVESVGFGHQDLVFGTTSGGPGIKIPISQSLMSKYYPQGGTIRVTMSAAPGMLNNPDSYDAGVAIQQNFDLYVTVFYIEPGPPNYSAIPK